MQIALLDWIILLGYLVFIAAIGIYVGLKVKDTDHYFLGGRRFGKWLMIGQSFGVGTHAEMPVSLAGAVYTMGASAIWFQWKNLFATPFYWIMAPVFRRIRRSTIAEMTEDRYGPWMAGIYTIFAVFFLMIATASMLKGAAKVISQAAGGDVGVNEIIIGMTVIFIIYSFIGGLVAAAWTDLFQGFLIIALSFMLIPLGLSAVGGMDGMRASMEAFKFSLATPEGIGIWVIFMLTINGLIGIMAQPHMLAAVGTGKDEYTCRVGFLYGNFVKRFATVGWTLVGLIVAAMVVQGTLPALADPEDAFGAAARQLLFPGSLGLLIASILAANMSSCSAFMVDSGALFTQGFYRKHVAPGRPDTHYLWIGRVSGFVIIMASVVYAFFLIERVLYSFLLTETMATFMGISVLGGIVWQRANRYGAVSSLVVAMGTNFLLYYLRGDRLDHWDPNVFLAALLAGIASLVVFSLLTPPEPQAAMNSFYGRLQTPTELDPRYQAAAARSAVSAPERAAVGVGAAMAPASAGTSQDRREEEEPQDPNPKADAAAHGQQSILINLLHPLRAAMGYSPVQAYKTDIIGFLIGWGLAIGLVAVTWLLFSSL